MLLLGRQLLVGSFRSRRSTVIQHFSKVHCAQYCTEEFTIERRVAEKQHRYAQLAQYREILHHYAKTDTKSLKEGLEKALEFIRSDGSNYTMKEVVDKQTFQGMTLLTYAARAGNAESVRLLLSLGADTNLAISKKQVQSSASSPMLFAALNNHKECVDALLDAGAHVSHFTIDMLVRENDTTEMVEYLVKRVGPSLLNDRLTYRNGDTLLHAAIQNGNLEIVKKLLELGADTHTLTKINDMEFDAFNCAAVYGQKDVINYFWKELKMDPNNLQPAAFTLVKFCQFQKLQLIIDMGVDLSKMRHPSLEVGRTLFWEAITNKEMIEFLVRSGMDINMRAEHDLTPLFCAASFGTPETLRLVLKLGADLNAQLDDGSTPISYATSLEKFQIFLDAGVDPCTPDLLPRLCADNSPEIVKLLLDKGAKRDIDKNSSKQWYCFSPLVMAAASGNFAVFQLLLEEGAYIDSGRGTEALFQTCSGLNSGHLAIIEKCLQIGIDVNSKTQEGYGALAQAADCGFTEVVALLLERGANINAIDVDGNTALHYAVGSKRESLEKVKLLLEKGARKDIRNKEGKSPLDLGKSNHDITQLLTKDE